MRIALTFDDGPSEWTERLLDAFSGADARATFFVIGTHALERPELLRRCAADGHEIGNHTWSHARLTECDDETVRDELRRASDAIANALDAPPRLFRAPYFAVDERVSTIAAELGLSHVGCTINPNDWRADAEAAAIVEIVLDQAHDRAIVDLHDSRPSGGSSAREDSSPTVEAVHQLLPALRERGYELVAVSEL